MVVFVNDFVIDVVIAVVGAVAFVVVVVVVIVVAVVVAIIVVTVVVVATSHEPTSSKYVYVLDRPPTQVAVLLSLQLHGHAPLGVAFDLPTNFGDRCPYWERWRNKK